MFALTKSDLNKSILGCGDGPASANAEITALGGNIVSVDPIYQFSAAQIRSRIDAVYPQLMTRMEEDEKKYVWSTIKDVNQLGEIRMSAMETFLSDYESASEEGRYIPACLPDLPFRDHQFELALCSHFLFLYSEQVNLDQHIRGISELCRVAEEARVYPLLALDGVISPHLKPVTDALAKAGVSVSLQPVGYQFQKGAVEMLVAKRIV
ncbi:MAG: SAM-dependent methyltransferase [Gammaproteobacteria bacterium]|jgi:hypothetical protein